MIEPGTGRIARRCPDEAEYRLTRAFSGEVQLLCVKHRDRAYRHGASMQVEMLPPPGVRRAD